MLLNNAIYLITSKLSYFHFRVVVWATQTLIGILDTAPLFSHQFKGVMSHLGSSHIVLFQDNFNCNFAFTSLDNSLTNINIFKLLHRNFQPFLSVEFYFVISLV